MFTSIFKKGRNLLYKVFVVALLLSSTAQSYAVAGKIEGSVTDAQTHKEIPAIKVELLNAVDSSVVRGGLTDNDGKYLFDGVAFGKYIIRFSGLSYRKYLLSDIELTPQKPYIKFGNTALITESKSLSEVTVYGFKMTGEMMDDKTVYTVNAKAAAVAQSGLDLLR